MGDNGSVWLPEAVSSMAPEIDRLFYFVTWTSAILFLGVVGAIVFFALKYRRRSPDEVPVPIAESKLLEVSWIIVPTILVLVIFNWGFKNYIRLSVAPPDSYQVDVHAAMWKWDFEYPNGTLSTGELHVPVNRPVRLRMSSADVLHSFFVPVFRVKQDVLPGRYTSVWFTATQTGEYQVFCTEYCGTQHSGMLAKVVVHTEDGFNEWLETAGVDEDMPLAEYGAVLYEQQACVQCHSLDGSTKVGPSFQGLFGRTETLADGSSVQVDENYVRESIMEPGAQVVQGFQPVMPPYATLDDRQVAALIEFIKEQ